MHNHKHHDSNSRSGRHINAFVDLNGVPYLLAEYLDKRQYQQIDRSIIKSEINVDQSDAMRAVIDIQIDDIGKRASDGRPSVIGNTTKQKYLLDMIARNREKFDHQLPTLRPGMIVRINYQVENKVSGLVIRSIYEDIRIRDRLYFLDINSKNIDDNSIIVNFSDTVVSTINDFTHGRDQMYLRITSIQLLYECVAPSPKMPRIKQSMVTNGNHPIPYECIDYTDLYKYNDSFQSRHVISDSSYGNEGNQYITPTTWSAFNRFYHFDNQRSDIVIHGQEVNDPMNKAIPIHCGKIHVNKLFSINPGHRLIFKLCVWKNDVTIVGDTVAIANALKVPDLNYSYDDPESDCDCECSGNDRMYEKLMRKLDKAIDTNKRQSDIIDRLLDRVSDLESRLYGEDNDPDDPDTPSIDDPEDPLDPPTDGPIIGDCDCEVEHDEIYQKINDVSQRLDSIDSINQMNPISGDTIKELFSTLKDTN